MRSLAQSCSTATRDEPAAICLTPWRANQSGAWRQVRTARSPLQGIYYWLPRPRGGWRLALWFAASEAPDSLRSLQHLIVWVEVLEHLASLWRANVTCLKARLAGCHAAIPRGRIGKTYEGYWVMGHGEQPIVPHHAERLKRVFHLEAATVRHLIHDHWDVHPAHQAELQAALGGPAETLL